MVCRHKGRPGADAKVGPGRGSFRSEVERKALDLLGDPRSEPYAGLNHLTAQAKRLDLPTRMAKADLHKMKPHHKALELPGTGGQLAHHVVTTQEGIYFQDVFTVACRDWRDFTLATLVAVELGLAGQPPVVIDPELSRMRSRGEQFDYVLGVAQEKGGLYEEADLKRFFPRAKVVLV